MSKQQSLDHLFLSMVASVTLFLLTVSYAPSLHAAVTESYKTSTATPVVLAWYNGPRYRGYGWGGYRNGYAYRCGRTCFINRWGYRHCYRRCN